MVALPDGGEDEEEGEDFMALNNWYLWREDNEGAREGVVQSCGGVLVYMVVLKEMRKKGIGFYLTWLEFWKE